MTQPSLLYIDPCQYSRVLHDVLLMLAGNSASHSRLYKTLGAVCCYTHADYM
jgi:hypothetical protein